MNEKVNILQMLFSLRVGGLETMVVDLVKRLDKSKYNVAVCAFNKDGELINDLTQDEIQVFTLKKKEGIDINLIFKLRELIKKNKISLIHSHNPCPWFYGVCASRLTSVRAVVHTEHSHLLPTQSKMLIGERLLSFFTNSIVCDSQKVADFIINKQGIKQSKVRVILNGIDTSKFETISDNVELKNALGINPNNLVIGCVARLEPVKDHVSLIRAFSLVKKDIPKLTLLLVGDGSYRQTLINESRLLNIEKDILFLGTRKDIPKLLQAIDIFVLSSLSEGLPLCLLEAMASKKPIVATSVGGIPEIIQDGTDGFLVPPQKIEILAGKIKQLLENEKLRSSFAEIGCKKVKDKFELMTMVEQYEDIYDFSISKVK